MRPRLREQMFCVIDEPLSAQNTNAPSGISLHEALPHPPSDPIPPELPLRPVGGGAKAKCEKDTKTGHRRRGACDPSDDGRQWPNGYCRLTRYRRATVSHGVRVREHFDDFVIIGRIVDARDPGWISRTCISERDDDNETG